MHFRTIDVHAQSMALPEGGGPQPMALSEDGGGLSISPRDR